MRRAFAILLLSTLVLAGCATPLAPSAVPASPPVPERPTVVVAVVDTGINFYHAEYAAVSPGGSAAPRAASELASTLGIPDLVELPLSLGDDWEASVEADRERLVEEIEKETLYAFPGTRVFAISFVDDPGQRCTGGLVAALSGTRECVDWPRILDFPGGHGTMTSSRAIGNTISIGGAEPDILLVLVQGFTPEALRWAADQEWIDIVSLSAGLSFLPIVPIVPNAGEAAGLSDGVAAVNYLAHRKPFFASTGNGFGNAGALGFPSWLRGASGTPDVLSVGANDNDRMTAWHNLDPYIAADGCDNPAADSDDSESVSDTGGGTSSATPFAAGGGAKLLLEARRILGDTAVGARIDETLSEEGWTSGRADDAKVVLARGGSGVVAEGPLADGVLTLSEFKQLIYLTALPVPTDDESDGLACTPPFGSGFPGGENLPTSARFPVHGYGEVNQASIEAALAVLRGEAPMPERPDDDRAYLEARERKMRAVGDGE